MRARRPGPPPLIRGWRVRVRWCPLPVLEAERRRVAVLGVILRALRRRYLERRGLTSRAAPILPG